VTTNGHALALGRGEGTGGNRGDGPWNLNQRSSKEWN